MTDNKKPSDQVGLYRRERWAEMERELSELKRSVSILRIGLILLGVAIICDSLIVYRNMFYICNALESVTDFNRTTLEILNTIKDFLF